MEDKRKVVFGIKFLNQRNVLKINCSLNLWVKTISHLHLALFFVTFIRDFTKYICRKPMLHLVKGGNSF